MKIINWVHEINKDWNGGYTALATEDSLIVTYNLLEVARIDYNNGRYVVTGIDNHAVAQLEFMVNR